MKPPKRQRKAVTVIQSSTEPQRCRWSLEEKKQLIAALKSKDGQTLMIRDEGETFAYQWSAADGRWVKIGSVIGGSGGSQQSSGKQLYQGKEYDYVFDVDIREDAPPLKLAYNVCDDPWVAAHEFLGENGLSQMYLDQVVKFIHQNTRGRQLGTGAGQGSRGGTDPFTGSNRYVPGSGGQSSSASAPGADPYTGGGRYIPGGAPSPQTAATAMTPGAGYDPFTGGGSYRPSYSNSDSSLGKTGAGDTAQSATCNAYFPKTSYLLFEQANIPAVIDKLKKFNATMADRIDEVALCSLEPLMLANAQPTPAQLDVIWKLLHWPKDMVFPALDLLRLSVRQAAVCTHFCGIRAAAFLPLLISFITGDTTTTANRMLALRALCNAFPAGERALAGCHEDILAATASSREDDTHGIQTARSSVVLNCAVMCRLQNTVNIAHRCMDVCMALAARGMDSEANFRLLVAIGTLISIPGVKAQDGLAEFAKSCQTAAEAPGKVKDCAENVLKAMQ